MTCYVLGAFGIAIRLQVVHQQIVGGMLVLSGEIYIGKFKAKLAAPASVIKRRRLRTDSSRSRIGHPFNLESCLQFPTP